MMSFGKGSLISSRNNTSTNTPIQQIKAAGQTLRGQKTQGLPKPVRNLQVAVLQGENNTRILRVSFIEDPSDPYFTDADLYLQIGQNNPTLIAMGTSPIVVTIPPNSSPSKVIVASSGNWGSLPLENCPRRVVNLA